jgi:hypothetical protein
MRTTCRRRPGIAAVVRVTSIGAAAGGTVGTGRAARIAVGRPVRYSVANRDATASAPM